MKKFSHLINERIGRNPIVKYPSLEKMSPFMNPVDWEDKFKPLIDHIMNNMDTHGAPSNPLFNKKTISKLEGLIDEINENYKDYYQNEIYDGSQEMFFSLFSIDVDYRDIIDCVQPLLDRTEDVEDYPNMDNGVFMMDLEYPKFKTVEELVEDVSDVHLKLQMLKCDFLMELESNLQCEIGNTLTITKDNKNIEEFITKNLPIGRFTGIKQIKICIYNKETILTK